MKILAFLIKIFIALILVILIVWIAIIGLLQTRRGQTWILGHAIIYLEQKTEAKIEHGLARFHFPCHLQIEDLKISREQYPLLTVKKIDLSCSLPALLEGRFVFSTFRASDVDILNLPASSINMLSQNSGNETWDRIRAPIYLKFEHFHLENVRFAPSIIHSLSLSDPYLDLALHSSLNLKGVISHNPFKESIYAHLLMSLNHQPFNQVLATIGLDSQHHQLSLSLHTHAFFEELISKYALLPFHPHLALFASGDMQAWQHLNEDDKFIQGHFKISLNDYPENLSSLIGKETTIKSQYILHTLKKINFFDLVIDNRLFDLQVPQLTVFDQEIVNGEFNGQIHSLAAFSPLIKQEINGTVKFNGQVRGLLFSPACELYASSPELVVDSLYFHDCFANASLISQNKHLKGLVKLSFQKEQDLFKVYTDFEHQDQTIKLSNLTFSSPHAHLKGHLSTFLPSFILDGFVEGELIDLSRFNFNASHLSTIQTDHVNFQIQLKPFQIDSQLITQALSTHFVAQNLQVNDCRFEELNFSLQTDRFALDDSLLYVDAWVQGKNANLNKNLSIDRTSASGSLAVNWNEKALLEIHGDVHAKGIKQEQKEILELSSRIDLIDPLKEREGQIELHLNRLQAESFGLEKLAITSQVHAALMNQNFQMTVENRQNLPLFMDMKGQWSFENEAIHILNEEMNGVFQNLPFTLLHASELIASANHFQVDQLNLKWGPTEFYTSFNLNMDQINGTLQTTAFSTEVLEFLAPDLPFRSQAEFSGNIGGTPSHPTGNLSIQIHDLQLKEKFFNQRPTWKGSAQIHFDGQEAQLKGQLTGIGNQPLLIDGLIPYSMHLFPLSFQLDEQKEFKINLTAEGEVEPYIQLFYPEMSHLSGHAKIALQLNGHFNAPQVHGSINLLNGSYESVTTGAIYRDIQAQLTGNGSQIVLSRFAARDNTGGTVTANGTVNLESKRDFPFEFQIQPTKIFITDSDYAKILASGQLTLRGNTKHSKLQGVLTVDQASMSLEQTLPREIKTVDVTYINLPEGQSPQTHLQKESNSAIDLEVKLEMPDHVVIEGNHVSSEWRGSLLATGKLDNLLLNGHLRLVKGEYDFNGRTFNLTQGNIYFGGPLTKKTTLYIVASQEIDRIKVEIIVKGLITKPQINFRSNPPLSQREVLSYILFNRGLSDITTDQGDQLTQSFISLNSSDQTAQSDDFLSRLRNNIGIDRLDFATGLDNYSKSDQTNKDFSLQIGKHLTENIYVSVNKSINDALAHQVAIQVNLGKNLKLQADRTLLGQDPQFRVSFKWKKDY